jgi:hypothetical protein
MLTNTLKMKSISVTSIYDYCCLYVSIESIVEALQLDFEQVLSDIKKEPAIQDDLVWLDVNDSKLCGINLNQITSCLFLIERNLLLSDTGISDQQAELLNELKENLYYYTLEEWDNVKPCAVHALLERIKVPELPKWEKGKIHTYDQFIKTELQVEKFLNELRKQGQDVQALVDEIKIMRHMLERTRWAFKNMPAIKELIDKMSSDYQGLERGFQSGAWM